VEDDVDVWRYAILELHARNDDDDVSRIWTELSVPAIRSLYYLSVLLFLAGYIHSSTQKDFSLNINYLFCIFL